MAKLIKKVVKTVKAVKVAKVAKEKKISAASIVLGMFGLKVVPTDEAIIQAVQEAVEGSKFDKTHLAWYKYQFRIGRWNDGEEQVIRQAPKPTVEKPAKAAKVAKKTKAAKKVVAEVEESIDDSEESED